MRSRSEGALRDHGLLPALHCGRQGCEKEGTRRCSRCKQVRCSGRGGEGREGRGRKRAGCDMDGREWGGVQANAWVDRQSPRTGRRRDGGRAVGKLRLPCQRTLDDAAIWRVIMGRLRCSRWCAGGLLLAGLPAPGLASPQSQLHVLRRSKATCHISLAHRGILAGWEAGRGCAPTRRPRQRPICQRPICRPRQHHSVCDTSASSFSIGCPWAHAAGAFCDG